MLEFYVKYFGCSHNEKYVNPKKAFEAYFLLFEDSSNIELMSKASMQRTGRENGEERIGFAHVAISVGTKEKVTELTGKLRSDGFRIVCEPRITGDGYFESAVLDPEGNRIEITV
jgi:lactoylglutathione lyase